MYSELDLRKIKGQALKDIWHAMIGKEPGLKNTTGMKTTDDIIAAILKGQEDPQFLEPFQKGRTPHEVTHKAKVEPSLVQMPPKSGDTKKKVVAQASESMEPPFKAESVEKRKVKKLHVGSELVFLETRTNIVFEAIANTPGARCGLWNPETKELVYDS